jgi:hypothetical protein
MTKTRRLAKKIWRYRRRVMGKVETFKKYLDWSQYYEKWRAKKFGWWYRKKCGRRINPSTFVAYPQGLMDKYPGRLDLRNKHEFKRRTKL